MTLIHIIILDNFLLVVVVAVEYDEDVKEEIKVYLVLEIGTLTIYCENLMRLEMKWRAFSDSFKNIENRIPKDLVKKELNNSAIQLETDFMK